MNVLAAQLKDWNEAFDALKKRKDKLNAVRARLGRYSPKAPLGQNLKAHALAKIEKELDLYEPVLRFFKENLDEVNEAAETIDLYNAGAKENGTPAPIGTPAPPVSASKSN